MSGKALTVGLYAKRVERVLDKLRDETTLKEYPALAYLLSHGHRREYLTALLEHIAHILQTIRSPEPITDKSGRINAYGVTISESMIQDKLRVGERKAGFIPALFAGTMLLNRRKTRDEQAIALSQKAGRGIIYCYWVDDWTEAQLKLKEQKAREWIDAGKPSKITKETAITIWGKKPADAISQDLRKKQQKTITKEKILIRAYDNLIRRTGQTIVTKQELFAELAKGIQRRPKDKPTQAQETERRWELYREDQEAIDRKEKGQTRTREEISEEVKREYREDYLKRCKVWPEATWNAGRAELFKQRELEYRRLRKTEKELYNRDTGLEWVLIPRILTIRNI